MFLYIYPYGVELNVVRSTVVPASTSRTSNRRIMVFHAVFG